MVNLDEIKDLIIESMIEYYGTQYEDIIREATSNIKYYIFNPREERIIQKINNENKFDFLLLGDKFFYDGVGFDENSKPVFKSFIAISEGSCNTNAKIVYALTEAYIEALMTYNTFTYDIEDRYHYKKYGTDQVPYGTDHYKAYLFDKACTKYEALRITQMTLKTNNEDFVVDYDYNLEHIKPLLDNLSSRDKVNECRIEHKPLSSIKEANFGLIKSLLNREYNVVLTPEVPAKDGVKKDNNQEVVVDNNKKDDKEEKFNIEIFEKKLGEGASDLFDEEFKKQIDLRIKEVILDINRKLPSYKKEEKELV